MAARCYLFTPVVPLVAMRGTQSDDPFIRKHARQGLVWAIPFLILLTITVIAIVQVVASDILYICLLPFALLVPMVPGAIWARKVYLGGDVTFPGMSQVP